MVYINAIIKKNQINSQPPKHFVIYSHGSGVRKDDRGLLTDIAAALPEVESVLFDYFQIDEANKTLTTCPFSKQVDKLRQVVNEVKLANPEAVIDLIGHSQGTIIIALARPENIRKVILLAPVFDADLERTLSRYQSDPRTEINLEGVSKLPSLDGLIRIVPAEYWRERQESKPIHAYNLLAEKTEVIVIEANQDQLLPKVDLSELNPKIKLTSLDGDHGFGGADRELLIKTIRGYIIG